MRGERLNVAEDTLDATGLRYQTAGGGDFGIVVRSHWTVCRQDPPPHTVTSSVLLTVARACEVPDLVGEPLDDSEDTLDDLGVGVREVGLDWAPIEDESDWTVCSQDPRGGAALEPTIELYVSRDCAWAGYSS